jgi:uncharacterized membrane protein YkoI
MKMKVATTICALLAVALLRTPLARAAGPKEKKTEVKVPVAQVPEAVKKAAQNAAPGITISRATKETEGKRTVYELEGKVGDKECELEITAEGKLLEMEIEVALAQVPDAVKKAAQKAVPGIVPTEAEKQTRGRRVRYEVEGKVGKKEYELVITAEGKVRQTGVEVPLAEVPDAVKKAAQKAVPGIVLTEAEKQTRGKRVSYELEGKAGKKEYELEITAKGKVLEVEVEDEADDD